MTLILIGFCFGTLFGLAIALALVRHEAHTDRRPGYVTLHDADGKSWYARRRRRP